MCVLVLSPHTEAASRLCSALERRSVPYWWGQDPHQCTANPLVAVVDAQLKHYRRIIERLMLDFPWCRCYVVMDRGAREVASVPLVRKPFDAAGFARELEREHELAALDRRRHALEARTEELAQLVQNSFEAIIGLDRDFNIISWNPGAQAIYGYSQEEVLGRPISILGDDFACTSRALEPAAKHVVETVRRTRSGADS